MQAAEHKPQTECWVDIFESSFFMGKMRRLFGPRHLKSLAAGSVIVGPSASLHLQCRRSGQDMQLQLKSNRLVPDLSAALRGAVLSSASVICDHARRPATKPGSRNGMPNWLKKGRG